MPEKETGKVLNIRGITEDSQAKALKRALQIATSVDEIKSSTS